MKTLKTAIRDWLGIKEPLSEKQLRESTNELEDTIKKLESELSFWKGTFRKFSRIPCAHCKKQMHVYPFGGAYYERNGQKVHAACYDDYLKKREI